jgi:hypothetical protein
MGIPFNTRVGLEVDAEAGTLDFFINGEQIPHRVTGVPKDVYFGVCCVKWEWLCCVVMNFLCLYIVIIFFFLLFFSFVFVTHIVTRLFPSLFFEVEHRETI